MTVKKLQSVYTTVRDMDRAVTFYNNVFGLPLKFRDGAKWTQFDVPGGSFALSSTGEAADNGRHNTVAVFEVDDLEAYAERIEKSGGKLMGRRDMGSHGATLTFADSEGAVLQLFAKAKKA